jgi:hypothetical protein
MEKSVLETEIYKGRYTSQKRNKDIPSEKKTEKEKWIE